MKAKKIFEKILWILKKVLGSFCLLIFLLCVYMCVTSLKENLIINIIMCALFGGLSYYLLLFRRKKKVVRNTTNEVSGEILNSEEIKTPEQHHQYTQENHVAFYTDNTSKATNSKSIDTDLTHTQNVYTVKQTERNVALKPIHNTISPQMENNLNPTYIKNGNSICRSDGKPISDEVSEEILNSKEIKTSRQQCQYIHENSLTFYFDNTSINKLKSSNKSEIALKIQKNKNSRTSNLTDKIDELNSIAQKASDQAHAYHKSQYYSLDFHSIHPIDSPSIRLTSTEKYFLKALAYQPIDELNLPVYWTYEYNINYKELITKLIENSYIEINSNINDLSLFKVSQLKEILKSRSLPVSGNKNELIKRILNVGNITEDELKSLGMYRERFNLTPKGKEAILNLPKSMTKNLEFEDTCISLILKQNFNEAYKIICKRELGKKHQNSVGIDWTREFSVGLSADKITLFTLFWNKNISDFLPYQCQNYIDLIKASVIFGFLMGVSVDKIILLLTRLAPTIEQNSKLTRSIQDLEFKLMDVSQIKSMYDLYK